MSFWNKEAKPITGVKGVRYGLQKPTNATSSDGKASKLAIFGDDAQLQHGEGNINAGLRAQAGKKRSDAKYEAMHAAALAEDANVYDYDSFHDGIQAEREAQRKAALAKERAGPQYIGALQAAMKEREREQNIVYERRLGRDRKVEDALHGDKEVFVGSAYKQKLMEDKLWQANQDLKDSRDAKNSARARGNMDGVFNLLSTVMREPAAAPAEEPLASARDSEPAVGAASTPVEQQGADQFQADLKKRADVRYQKALADMDKHELARHRLEMRLQERAASQHEGASRDASRAAAGEGGVEAAGSGRDQDVDPGAQGLASQSSPQAGAGDAGQTAAAAQRESDGGTLKRRADEPVLSAAKQRYLERKQARLAAA